MTGFAMQQASDNVEHDYNNSVLRFVDNYTIVAISILPKLNSKSQKLIAGVYIWKVGFFEIVLIKCKTISNNRFFFLDIQYKTLC